MPTGDVLAAVGGLPLDAVGERAGVAWLDGWTVVLQPARPARPAAIIRGMNRLNLAMTIISGYQQA